MCGVAGRAVEDRRWGLDSDKDHAATQPPVTCDNENFGQLDMKLAQHAVLLDMVSARNSQFYGNISGISANFDQ